MADFCSEKMLGMWEEDKTNVKTVDQLFDEYIQLYNDCIFKRPSDMHVGIHLCRGNRHFSEGGYDRIATKLFQKLNADTYYLEYDTPRAGSFEPLRHMPKNILEVITSELEDIAEMRDKVFVAANFIAEGNNEARRRSKTARSEYAVRVCESLFWERGGEGRI